MSSGGGPTLMDVFVGVKPDPQFMQQIESNFGEARNKIRQMFEGIQTDAGQAAANAMVSRLQEINRLLQDMEARADRLRQQVTSTAAGVRPGAALPALPAAGQPIPAGAVSVPVVTGGGRSPVAVQAANDTTEIQRLIASLDELQFEFRKVDILQPLAKLSQTSQKDLRDIRVEFLQLKKDLEDGVDIGPDRVPKLESKIGVLGRLVNQRMEALVNPAGGNESAINDAETIVRRAQDNLKVRRTELLSSLAGVSSEDRQALQLLNAQLEQAVIAYNRAKRDFQNAVDEASSREAVARVRDTAAEVNTIASNASEKIDKISQSRVRNFNALSNSAYQLGQAFEDAAIGYQLNGLAGALRGASNNISFVLNNLAQTPAIQDSIARRFGIAGSLGKDLVGITAGIGAALAITVLPPTVAWLESLNDIELELEDISERYSEIVGKTERQVRLSLETQQFTRGVARADNFRAVLDSLDDLREKAQDTRIEIAETVDGLANSGAFAILKTQFDSISKGIDTVIEKYRKQAEFLRQPSLLPLGAPDGLFSPDKVLRAQEKPLLQFRATRDAIVSEIERIQRSSRDFPVAPESFDNARKLLNKLQDDLKATIGREDFADFSGPAKDAAAQLEANLKPLDKTLEDLRNRAEEFRELTTRRLTEGIEAALRQTEVLQQRQLLIRERLSGREIPGGEMLLDVVEMSRAYQDLIDKQLKLYERAGMARQDIERVRAALQRQADLEVGNQSLEQQADILEQIRQAEERIAELQGRRRDARSQNINFDSYMTKLQENALSQNEDNTKALKDVTKELQNLNVRLVKLQAFDLIRNQRSFLEGELGQISADPRIPGAAQQAARLREQIRIARQLEMFLPGFNPVVPGRGAFSMPVMAPGMGPAMGVTELVLRNAVLDGFSVIMQFLNNSEISQKILGVQDAIKQGDWRARVVQ